MIRTALTIALAAAVPLIAPALAVAQPADPAYVIGKCYDPGARGPRPEPRPAQFAYNCDRTGVMDAMTWTEWGPGGAVGTGTDRAVECKPNCAEGPTLVNPIAVRAWNPQPGPGCPPSALFYTDLTIAYPQGAPPWITPGTKWDAGTEFVTVDGKPAVHYSGPPPVCRG